jgi:hypothetical protein
MSRDTWLITLALMWIALLFAAFLTMILTY